MDLKTVSGFNLYLTHWLANSPVFMAEKQNSDSRTKKRLSCGTLNSIRFDVYDLATDSVSTWSTSPMLNFMYPHVLNYIPYALELKNLWELLEKMVNFNWIKTNSPYRLCNHPGIDIHNTFKSRHRRMLIHWRLAAICNHGIRGIR